MIGRLSLLGPIAWRNLWRNPRRTVITLAVVAIGVWSILSFDVLLKAFADSSREASLRLLTGEAQIHARGFLDDPSISHRLPAPGGPVREVLESPHVTAWAQRLRVPAIARSEYRTRAITLVAVDPAAERRMSDIPAQITAGRYLAAPGDDGVVIGQDLAAKLKTRVGKRIIVLAQDTEGRLSEASHTIVGLYDAPQAAEDEFVFTGLTSAQGALGAGTDLTEIAIDARDAAALPVAVIDLRKAGPDLDVRPWMELSPLAYTIETFSQSYTAIWLLIMFVLMAIGIVNTQLMAVFERTREFGLLQALGMKPGLIVLQVTLESALLIGLGVVAGIVLMFLTLVPFVNGMDLGFLAAGIELVGSGHILYPKFVPATVASLCLVVWVLGVLAALWPARAAAKADPVVAMGQL